MIVVKGLCEEGAFSVDQVEISPGHTEEAVVHYECDECLYVLSGRPQMRVGAVLRDGRPGDCIAVPRGVAHAVANPGVESVALLAVCSPPYRKEFDHEVREDLRHGR